MSESWRWNAQIHPRIEAAFDGPNWCNQLDGAGSDTLTGKVLCVCAALGIAREVERQSPSTETNREALGLLEQWIDDPTVERFDQICDLLFRPSDGGKAVVGGVAWWALRTSTSTDDYGEPQWALNSTCAAAEASGFSNDFCRRIARIAVEARKEV